VTLKESNTPLFFPTSPPSVLTTERVQLDTLIDNFRDEVIDNMADKKIDLAQKETRYNILQDTNRQLTLQINGLQYKYNTIDITTRKDIPVPHHINKSPPN